MDRTYWTANSFPKQLQNQGFVDSDWAGCLELISSHGLQRSNIVWLAQVLKQNIMS